MKVTKTERLGNGILLVTVPVTFKWRNTGNGPVIINPDSSIVDLRRETILTAVARGRRWVQLLDDGSVESIRAIAAKIGREPNYVARLIRLSMLAPDIIHRILEGDIPRNLSLERLRVPIPDLWEEQRRMLLENQ